MKRILILMLFVIGCTPDDNCDCQKQVRQIEQYVVIENGLPKMKIRKTLIEVGNVGCQDESTTTNNNIETKIICQ